MSARFLTMAMIWFCLTGSASAQNIEGIGKQKPFTLSGGINLQGLFYNANGIQNRNQPFSYIISGNPTISLYKSLIIPFEFTFSEKERSFRQPFNQFGISPSYKWITVYAGYRNVSYSQFTLAGHTFLGAGVDLHPGIFRFGFIYGRFNRATGIDTTTRALQPYSYENKGFATKIGVGKGPNFLELSFLKAKDDSTSVNLAEDTLGRISPAENVVIGLHGQAKFLKNFTFAVEAATSLYTNNLRNSSPFHDSTSTQIVRLLDGFIDRNGTTEHSNALQTSLGYKSKKMGLRLQFSRIDPHYKSMGAYFFSNDLQNLTIAPSLNLLKNKLRLNGSLGMQHDNLKKQKQSSSSRVIGSANASANLNDHFGFDLNYSNYSNSQRTSTVLLRDTFRIAQVSQNFSFTPHYIVAGTEHIHALVFSANYNLFASLDNSTAIQNNTKSYNIFLNYQITFVPTNLTLSTNLNYTDVKGETFEEGNSGITLGINKTLLKSKLILGWTGSFLEGLRGGTTGLILNEGANLNYRVSKHQSMAVNLNYIKNNSANTNLAATYSEFRGKISYRYVL